MEGQLREHCGTCEKREDNSDSDSFVNRVKKIVTRVGLGRERKNPLNPPPTPTPPASLKKKKKKRRKKKRQRETKI